MLRLLKPQHAFVYDLVLVQHIYMQPTVQVAQSPLVQNGAELKCYRLELCLQHEENPNKNIRTFFFFALTKALMIVSLFHRIMLYRYITAG